jgi:hypothetical protein
MILPPLALALQTAPTQQEQDLRCIAVISATIGTMPEDQRSNVIPLATYYIGRATGRDPRVDLEADLRRLLSDDATFSKRAPDELQRCAAEMKGVGEQLQRLGKALEAGPGPRKQ